jgi:hypothetical protein
MNCGKEAKKMTGLINDDLKEILSFRVPMSLLCFNINYAHRYERISLKKLSYLLNLNPVEIERTARIFQRIGMAKLFRDGQETMIEMTDTKDPVIKNTIFDVIWEHKYDYAVIYKQMAQNEMESSLGTNP